MAEELTTVLGLGQFTGAKTALRYITALFCANDQMALGAYRALREAGLRVPEDVSVVGFDDNDEAAMYAPPLSTVAQDWAVLGELALTTALAMTRGAEPRDSKVPQRFVERESTAAYRGH